LPIGIIGSLVICTVLYIFVALMLTGVVPYTQLNVPHPIAIGIEATGLYWLAVIVEIGAVAGLSSVLLVTLMGQPRIFYAMAHDGLLPPVFAQVHPR
jgi:APA family basic amino acid/polyamine antiporter